MNYELVYFVVSIETTENPKFHCTRTDDAWWNFQVWKFHKIIGDLIEMGSLDHRNVDHCTLSFWGLESPLWPGLRFHSTVDQCASYKCSCCIL